MRTPPSRPWSSRARRRPATALLVVAVASFGLLSVLAGPAPAEGGDPIGTLIVEEAFDTLPGAESGWRFGGTGQDPLTRQYWYPEIVEDRLRLAPGRSDGREAPTSGSAIYDVAQPTVAGLDVTFTTQQWGGTGADGIAFFLVDGETSDIVAGNSGGRLGYVNLSGTGGVGALVGVGLDTYGNFAAEETEGCPTRHDQTPQALTVRGGPEDVWCVLAAPVPGMHWTQVRTVRVLVDPSTEDDPRLRVLIGGEEQLDIEQPQALQDVSSFKLGFTASTGGSNNNHDLWDLEVRTIEPLPELIWALEGATVLPAGRVDQAYLETFSFDNAVAPVTLSVVDGSLPAGLELSGPRLQGTPTEPGSFAFTLRAEDSRAEPSFQQRAFTLEVVDNALALTGSFDVADRAYDQTSAATITAHDLELGPLDEGLEDVSITALTAQFDDPAVGEHRTVRLTGGALTGADAGSYALDLSSAPTTTATIAPRELGVTGLLAADRPYDGTTQVDLSGGQLTGVLSGDEVALTVASVGTAAAADPGTQLVNVAASLAGEHAGNYLLPPPTTSVTITPRALPVAGMTVASRPFDGTRTATLVGGSLTGVVDGDTVALTGRDTARFAAADAGTHQVQAQLALTGADAGFYTLEPPALSGTITRAAATLSFSGGLSWLEGTTGSPRVVTEPVGLSGVTVSFDAGEVPTVPGTYRVTASLAHRNYAAEPRTATVTVIAAPSDDRVEGEPDIGPVLPVPDDDQDADAGDNGDAGDPDALPPPPAEPQVQEDGEPVDTTTSVDDGRVRVSSEQFAAEFSSQSPEGNPAAPGAGGHLPLAAGGTTQGAGSGYAPDSRVEVWILPDAFLGSAPVGDDGTFAASFPVPDDLPPGAHTMQLNGLTPAGLVRSLSLAAEVPDELPAPDPQDPDDEVEGGDAPAPDDAPVPDDDPDDAPAPDDDPGDDAEQPAATIPQPVTPATDDRLVAGDTVVEVDGLQQAVEVVSQDGALQVRGEGFGVRVAPDLAASDTEADVRFDALTRGQVVELAVEGFAPNTLVGVWLLSDPQALGSFTVNGDGSLYAVTEVVAEDTPACQDLLQVVGQLPGGRQFTVSVGVWVDAAGQRFVDVPVGTVHARAIGCLADLGITHGVTAEAFQPARSLSRGQAASLLARMFDLDLTSNAEFSDVVGTAHEGAIAALSSAGMAQGFDDGTFRPHDPLTRGQFATMLARLLKMEFDDVEVVFPDAGQAHGPAISLLAEYGILLGFEDGTVRPGAIVSRAQIASMLVRGLTHLDE